MVAEITTVSLGVGYEISYAENKKPILCLFRQIEGKRVSAMITGNKKLNVREYQIIADVPAILEDFFHSLS